MTPQLTSAIVGALGGAGYGLTMYAKKCSLPGASPSFEARKLAEPVLVGAVLGLIAGFSGESVTSIESSIKLAGTSGFITALLQLGQRQGGTILGAIVGRLKGKV